MIIIQEEEQEMEFLDEVKVNGGLYKLFMKAQLTELLTNYGEIGGIWFDGEWDQFKWMGKDLVSLWQILNLQRFIL